ncbi:MAG: DNA-3-methyladenine glycosylase [Propionibacteriaceae bacterium]|jgi:DNA-3-methyladenine glycosylase|nr:DNA-3-methyladenine glycosylase [Propionibacteriaceae bacterium]
MRLEAGFYQRDVLEVAPELLGKTIVRVTANGEVRRGRITEVEAYRGEEDTACHARAGRTKRTEPLYHAGGCAYVYLCYGIHHLMNVVTGPEGLPQAALIRGLVGVPGPGRAAKALGVTLADNRTDLTSSSALWLEDDGYRPASIETTPRIGIGYASPEDQARLWRYVDRDGIKRFR